MNYEQKTIVTVDTLIKALEQTKENSRGREGTPKDLGDLAMISQKKRSIDLLRI